MMEDLTEHVRRSLDPLDGQSYSAVYEALIAAARSMLGLNVRPATLQQRLEAYHLRRGELDVLSFEHKSEWIALLVLSFQLVQEHDG